MGLETAPFINSLNSANPVGATDTKGQGDDHIRLIKAAIKATFPNLTGAMTLTQAQLNAMAGLVAARLINAGVGLTGGGDLSADRTLSMGAPSTCTLLTSNGATGTTHTHDIDIPNATTSVSGLLSAADKVILDALNAAGFVTLTGAQTLTNKALNGTLGATTPATAAVTTLTASGAVVSGGQVSGSQNFSSTSAAVVLGCTGAGNVYLRPNGVGSATGEARLDSTGVLNVATDVSVASDRRLKKFMKTLGLDWAKEMLMGVKPISFQRKRQSIPGIGFIAQEVEQYAPELIHEDARGYKTLSQQSLVAVLWRVIQDQEVRLEKLEAKL